MPVAPPANRAVYVSSERFRIVSLVFWGMFGALLSLLISAAMMWLVQNKMYVIGLVSIFAGVAISGIAILVVQVSHCRNWKVAGALCFVMGVFAYLGYYHLDMLRRVGFQNWHRVDATPRHILFRWRTDALGNPALGRPRPNPWFNILFFCVEAGFMGGFAAHMSMWASGKPYSESAQRWLRIARFKCPAGSGDWIARSLANGWRPHLTAALTPSQSDAKCFNLCELYFCPLRFDPGRMEPVFLSMTEMGPLELGRSRHKAPVIVYWHLNPEEVEIIVKAFPKETGGVVGAVSPVA